jgi:hypothetical protein
MWGKTGSLICGIVHPSSSLSGRTDPKKKENEKQIL